jgi:hypothetical protein
MEQTHQGLVEKSIWFWSGEQRDHTGNEQRHHHFGTYWPFLREGAQTLESAGSLWTKLLTKYLQPNGILESPREYVGCQLTRQMVHRLGNERSTCALIGDLNGRMMESEDGADPVILDTMCSKG